MRQRSTAVHDIQIAFLFLLSRCFYFSWIFQRRTMSVERSSDHNTLVVISQKKEKSRAEKLNKAHINSVLSRILLRRDLIMDGLFVICPLRPPGCAYLT